MDRNSENLESLKFYIRGKDVWEGMLEAIRTAQHTIELEQFIFEDDETGRMFAEALRERAKAGVSVRVLCDTVGSWGLYTSHLPASMQSTGVQIRFFNKVSPWRIHKFLRWFFRDHRKILIIDRTVGFTGGTGIRKDMADWRDTNIRVIGPIVGEMLHSFNMLWAQTFDRRALSRFRKARYYTAGFEFITNAPFFRRRFLYWQIIDALRAAKKSIFITTPYFIPDKRLARVLKLAARRGVDVRIIVPHKYDEPFVGLAAHSHYEGMLRAGVKIFEYHPHFLHAKTIVIDDEWSTVGSFNLDPLSFVYNYEANVVSIERDFSEHIRTQFMSDLADSPEIRLDDWHRRPLHQKLREFLVLPIRRFL